MRPSAVARRSHRLRVLTHAWVVLAAVPSLLVGRAYADAASVTSAVVSLVLVPSAPEPSAQAPSAPSAPAALSPPSALVPPPGIPPSRVALLQRPPMTLVTVLREITEPKQVPVAGVAGPTPGSATESEALRRYVRGKQRAMDGQYARAADDIDAALRLDPSSTALRATRARIAGAAGDLPRAKAEWEAVLAQDPTDLQALISVGVAAFDAGQPSRTAALLGAAWIRLRLEGFAPISDAGRAAVGAALARSLFRLGFDEAGLEVAAVALAVPAESVAEQRGDGIDAASRAAAQLALESGEAALRAHRPDVAFALFARSVELTPHARTVALAAYAQLLAGDSNGARATLGVVMDDGPWRDAERTALASWLLTSLGGDARARETLALAAIAAVPIGSRAGEVTPEAHARIARLMVAAGDPDAGAAELDSAIADGAVDQATLEAAFRRSGDNDAPVRAHAAVSAHPECLRDACRALVRASSDLRTLRVAIDALPADSIRESIAAGVLATVRNPGAAWRRADGAAELNPSRAPLEAMLLAAVSAEDPALVARAAASAPVDLDVDASWHASLACAFAETGATTEAEQSLARAELLAESMTRMPSGLRRSLADAHALVDGRAAEGSARARAEGALARDDAVSAVAELLLAQSIDPDDAASQALLIGLLPRTEGPRAVAEWLAVQLARSPNDPLLWQPAVMQAASGGRAADALARVDARLALDPQDTLALPWREALLRITGRSADAAAAARVRIESLPSGPRRSLEEADNELQFGSPESSVDALGRFYESAYPPPTSMRAAALDIARRIPAKTPGRAQIMRRIARDAIFTDPRASLEFFAFEALGAASDPAMDSQSAADAVAMIAAEAAALDTFQYSSESWRACADFLLSQQQPRAAGEFLRACLEDPSKRTEEEIALLARAAVACDAIVGGRAGESLALAGRLRGLGHHPFGNSDRPGSESDVLSGILSLLGDSAGAELVLEAGLAVDPADGGLLNNLGFARLERGLADARTEQLLEQALRLRPSDSGTLDSMGWLRYLQGRLTDADGVPGAISLLERSVASQGKAPSAVKYDHLGDARWRAGDHNGARLAWLEAVRIAEGGLTREQTIELLRAMFRKQFGLGAIDAARYYNAHDGQVAARARGKIEAVTKGVEPEVAPTPATTPTNPPELRKQ